MLDKLSAIEDKFHVLEEQLSDPGITSDLSRFKRVNKDWDSSGDDGRSWSWTSGNG